jgi:FMN reductase
MLAAPRGNSQDDSGTASTKPLILALGGSTRTPSTSEAALRILAEGAIHAGADVHVLTGTDLMLPMYDPDDPDRTPEARRLVDLARRSDGLIVVSPGYHGGLSGLVKNALDYFEDLRGDPVRPYLDGRAVGCTAVAHGWQAAVGTLHQLRQVVHALRGWPTPYGAMVNSSEERLGGPASTSAATQEQLYLVAAQVVEFAHMRAAYRLPGGEDVAT